MSTFKDHFSTLAAQYAAFRPTYPPGLFHYLAGLAPGRGRAWDCACGNGQATLALAALFQSVIGTDASQQQLAAAQSLPGVEYRVARAEQSGLPAESVDLITVAQALHWFDLAGFYAEVRRVLRPAGVLAVWTYGALHLHDARIDALTLEFYRDIVGPFWPAERQIVESGYRQLPFPFAEVSPPAFEMTERWNLARLLGYLRTWSATARFVDKVGRDPVADLEEKLLPMWGEPRAERTVSWPLAVRIGRVP